MKRVLDISAQTVIGIGILASFSLYMVIGGVLGALLIPYNIARIVTWILEKMVEGVAFVLAVVEDWV